MGCIAMAMRVDMSHLKAGFLKQIWETRLLKQVFHYFGGAVILTSRSIGVIIIRVYFGLVGNFISIRTKWFTNLFLLPTASK
eukprot:3525272-Amphidinium_carterae.1